MFDTRAQALSWGERLELNVKAQGPAKFAASIIRLVGQEEEDALLREFEIRNDATARMGRFYVQVSRAQTTRRARSLFGAGSHVLDHHLGQQSVSRSMRSFPRP